MGRLGFGMRGESRSRFVAMRLRVGREDITCTVMW
jgi:hypothetical protein